jgi:hypothetical protein
MKMSIRRFEIERFSVTSSKPFDAVVAALKTGVGRLDLVEFAKASKGPRNFAELEKVINRDIGRTGLMINVYRVESGRPRFHTWLNLS